MALIVEDGTLASPSANTYISLDDAAAYCSGMGFTFATSSEGEAAILRAMAYIESFDFKGTKAYGPDDNVVQPLKWPRVGAYDEDGYAFEDDYIPPNLIKAVAYAASLEYESVGALSSVQNSNIKREKVDVIETEYFTPTPTKKEYPLLIGYLEGLIKGNLSGFVKVVRT